MALDIDWKNPRVFPRRKSNGATREDLAARKFNIGKAQHKGRCHISNQKRRQIEENRAKQAKVRRAMSDGEMARYKQAVRAFWLGFIDEHPSR